MRFVPVSWSDKAAQELCRCYDQDGFVWMMRELEKEVNSGDATLYEARTLNGPVGYVVARVEIVNREYEFVIVAAAMRENQSLKRFLPAFECTAAGIGCKRIRLHSTKKGMWRMFEAMDFENVERVYSKGLT